MAFKTATVNASDVAATLTDYPTYVDLSRLGITTLAEAQSVRVYADSGKTTEWAREIVSVSEMHVKIPSLTTTTVIYVDYDGVRADYAVGATYGRNAVWVGYSAVYHFEDDPAGGTLTDSTGNSRNGTAQGSMTSGDKISGPFGSAWDFDGSNDTVQLDSYATDFETAQFSVTAWALSENADIRDYEAIFSLQQGGGPFSKLWVGYQGGLYFRTASANDHALGISTAADDGSWHHFAVTIQSNSQLIYLDASVNASNNSTRNVTDMTSLDRVAISSDWYANNQRFRNGQVATVRVRDDILSADWLTTEYNNQSDEATFWGTWTDAGGGGPTANNSARRLHLMEM
jgi:hypothetical protein